jgi:hypothetical protein
MATQNSYYGSDNPFMDYLEQLPAEAAYYSGPTATSFMEGPLGAQRYYQNQFQNVYNEYLGALGTQARTGQGPVRWTDWLEQQPFTERYAALTPEMAGRTTRRFSPGTRQIYF